MTTLTNWISPSLMQSIAWALLHFLWQGLALAALAGAVMALCRRASSRYAIAVSALALMMAAPLVTFLLLIAAANAAPASRSFIAQAPSRAASNFVPEMSSSASHASPPLDYLPWLVEAWLLGVAFFSLRSAGGFLLLERQRRKQSNSVSDQVLAACHTMQRKLGLDRAVRYCECTWLQAPAVIGWFRPIVLLPATALSGLSEEQLRSIIAHELAHIRRYDAFVNLFQMAVETLLFYHPAIWWLNQRIRTEREHCCDDTAVSVCGNAIEYARALTLMEEWRTVPALAMAANHGPLSGRILRLLGFKSSADRARRIGLAGSLFCLTAALLSASVLLRVAYPRVHAGAASLAQISLPHFAQAATTQASAAPSNKATAASKPSPSRPQAAPASASGASYIDGLKSAGLDNLTVDQLIAMKIQGVTPGYVRDLRGLGFSPTANELVAMKIQGITPDYVRGLKDAGLQSTIDELISMKIQGVTPEYIKGLQDAGFKFSVDDVIAAKIQEIDADFIQQAVKHGFQNLTLEKLIQLKNLGVLEPQADL